MKPKAEIMARLRKERAKDGLKEVRSIIAPVKYHAEIKANAAKYLAKLVKRSGAAGADGAGAGGGD